MSKLSLPKNPYKGLKIFCKKCNKDNSNCKHYGSKVFRVRVHIPGTKNSVRTKKLEATNYSEAVVEAISFEKELIANNFNTVNNTVVENQGNDYSLADAVIRYKQYLNGESNFTHLKKNISVGHRKELYRFCQYFSQNVRKRNDITKLRVRDVGRDEVSIFFSWASERYKEKTLKKCMNTLKGFFEFLIDIEEIEMRNPFRKFIVENSGGSVIETITKEEFEAVINAFDKACKENQLKDREVKMKKMCRPYLKDAFKLFLYTGCRREELVVMKWNNIHSTDDNVKYFYIENLKVQRLKNRSNIRRPIPITAQLMELLVELGYNEKHGKDEYILCPDRTKMSDQSLMDFLSEAFTHYWKSTKSTKNCSLKTLRKTYLSWANIAMGKDTMILSSHSSDVVLEKHYLDPKLSPVILKGAATIKIFN
ncbi:hypothetical protein DM790_25855 [Flavobacterium collinsii]|nr:hypothetical protein [Flavobacterium collinsii]